MPKSEAEIRKKAHEIWEREGRPDGHHERHWAEAAKEVAGGDKPKATRARKAAPAAADAAAVTVKTAKPKAVKSTKAKT